MENVDSIRYLNYHYHENTSMNPTVCYSSILVSPASVFEKGNPFALTVPLFILQLLIVISTSRFVGLLISPFRQPRYVSEIIGGFILGPSVMGRIPHFNLLIFPLRSLIIIDTFAQFGIIFFFFMVGVEGEKYMTNRKDVKPLLVSIVCVIPSFALGALAGLLVHRHLHEDVNTAAFLTFLGFTLTDNSFHTLVRILSELKLINSEAGRLALSSSMIIHILMWTLLIFNIALAQAEGRTLTSLWAFLSGLAFFHLTLAFMKPTLRWAVGQLPEGTEVSQTQVNVILLGVMVWALLAELVGTHHIIGALAFGLSIPNGPLSETLAGKVDDFIDGLFIPLFFLVNGLRMNFGSIRDLVGVVLLVVVVLVGAGLKIIISIVLATVYKMSPRDGLSLGLLMNVKGSIDIIVLNVGSSKRMLGEQSFTVITLTTMLLAVSVTPLLKAVTRSAKSTASYKRRTVWWPNPESELRLLACIHIPRQAPSLISLLDITQPSKRSPIFVYALHLIELNARTSALLLNSMTSKTDDQCGNVQSRVKGQSDNVFNPFEAYAESAAGVSIQFLTAVSPYATMDEDVIAAARDRHVALILLPFHKRTTIDGGLSPEHPAMRGINRKILNSAPCSVGIIVDRGFGNYGAPRQVMLLFLGGPDDREGLSLMSRMAGHQNVRVNVIRFLDGLRGRRSPTSCGVRPQAESAAAGEDDDSAKDEECIAEFRGRCQGEMVGYVERVVGNAEELVAEVRGLDGGQDLYVVGKGDRKESPLTEGLAQWSECPELGPIGDLLASPDFGTTASVLVLQGGGLPSAEMCDPKVRRRKGCLPTMSKHVPGQNV